VVPKINTLGRSPMVTRREALEALRDRLTDETGVIEGKDLPPLSRELRAIWAELDALPSEDSKAPADEIAARREERRRQAASG
jgi:hypothetical protein